MSPMHLTPVNVAYGDGHTQWVYWANMQAEYDALPFNAFNSSYNAVMENYYLALGRQ